MWTTEEKKNVLAVWIKTESVANTWPVFSNFAEEMAKDRTFPVV